MEDDGRWVSQSVQSLGCVQVFATPWIAAHQASLSISNSWSLPKLMSIESVMTSNLLILCCPLLLLPSIFPSIRVFSSESVLPIKWPMYWNFSFCISPSNEYSGLISFRMDCLDLLPVHGTLKSLLQHHSSKASIHRCSAFFIVQLSHPYMTTTHSKGQSPYNNPLEFVPPIPVWPHSGLLAAPQKQATHFRAQLLHLQVRLPIIFFPQGSMTCSKPSHYHHTKLTYIVHRCANATPCCIFLYP